MALLKNNTKKFSRKLTISCSKKLGTNRITQEQNLYMNLIETVSIGKTNTLVHEKSMHKLMIRIKNCGKNIYNMLFSLVSFFFRKFSLFYLAYFFVTVCGVAGTRHFFFIRHRKNANCFFFSVGRNPIVSTILLISI